MITIEPISAFTDNYIWLITSGKNAFAVDPGDAAPLISVLEKRKLNLKGILITHHHYDHSGGILDLLNRYNTKIYGPHGGHIKGITHTLKNNQVLDLLGYSFKALCVPGHTDDQIAYYSNTTDNPILFSGDTLFAAGCGRIFEGTAEQMHKSLQKFSKLPLKTLVYCGHEYTLSNLKFASKVEPLNKKIQSRLKVISKLRDNNIVTLPTSILEELETNPFMRCNKINVIKAAENYSAKQDLHEFEVLGAIRAWKDNF